MFNPFAISLDDLVFSADGDFNPSDDPADEANAAHTRLSAQVTIGGYFFHVQAIEVNPETGDAVNPSLQDEIDAIATLVAARPGEQEIDGRHYVISIFPHSY